MAGRQKIVKRRLIERPWLIVALGLTVIVHALVILNLQNTQPPPDIVRIAHIAPTESARNDVDRQPPPQDVISENAPEIQNLKPKQPVDRQQDAASISDSNTVEQEPAESDNQPAESPSSAVTPPSKIKDNAGDLNAPTIDPAKNEKSVPAKEDAGKGQVQPIPKPGAGVDRNAIISAYRSKVLAAIELHKKYPSVARRLSQEGSVRMKFSVSRDGSVSGISIVSSSGVDAIDRAAIDAIRAASPIPPVPSELNENSLNLSLTILFSLK